MLLSYRAGHASESTSGTTDVCEILFFVYLKLDLKLLEENYQSQMNKELMDLIDAKGIDTARVIELIHQNA